MPGYTSVHFLPRVAEACARMAVAPPDAPGTSCAPASGERSNVFNSATWRAMLPKDYCRTKPAAHGRIRGFQTGDMVRADVPMGARRGVHLGRVAVSVGCADGINAKYGNFSIARTVMVMPPRFLPVLKDGFSSAGGFDDARIEFEG